MENLALVINYYGKKNGVEIDFTKDVIVMDVGNGASKACAKAWYWSPSCCCISLLKSSGKFIVHGFCLCKGK